MKEKLLRELFSFLRSSFRPVSESIDDQPLGAVSARRSSTAHRATAVCASSSTRPIVMKPWICRSKQT
jgi:hypothetical protein